MQANTALLHKLPQTAQEIKEAATYLKAAPIAENHWQVIKGVYKQLETNPNAELLTLLIHKFDKAKFADLKGQFPSRATLGYMKRRGNRYLRTLAKDNPELYFQICSGLLERQTSMIDLANQWVLMKMLFGKSKRYEQKRHGRGAFVRLENTSDFARNESTAPQIWADNLDYVAQLLKKNGLDTIVYEFAVKTLSANRAEMPDLSESQLKTFFDTDSIWLKVIAAKKAYESFKKEQIKDAQLLANTYFHSPANIRKTLFGEIKELIEGQAKPETPPSNNSSWIGNLVRSALGMNQIPHSSKAPNKKEIESWYRTFAANISHLFFSQNKESVSARRLEDMKELTLQLKDYVSFTIINKHITAIFEADDTRLNELAFAVADQVSGSNIMTWLAAVPSEKTVIRQRLQNIFIRKMDVSKLSWQDLEGFVFHEEFSIADFGWHLVSKWSQQARFTQRFWGRHYYYSAQSHQLLHFIQSEYGVRMLLKHSKSQLNWVMWYKQNFIYIYKNALPDLKKAFKPLFYANARGNNFVGWLPFIAELTEERDALYLNLQGGVSAQNLISRAFIDLLVSENGWVKQVAWNLFLKHCLNKKHISDLTVHALQHHDPEISNKYVQLLSHSEETKVKNLFFEVLPSLIENKPELINRLIPVFEHVIGLLNERTALNLMETLTPNDWTSIRSHLVKFLAEHPFMWTQILDKVHKAEIGTLQMRTIDDPEVLELFFKTKDADVLDYHQPIYADMLYEWIQQHLDFFTADSEALFKATIHKDPKIRQWAFEQTNKVGIAIPFALRMMEAGMPETFRKGVEYFEAVPANDPEEVEYVLALCDSPQKVVRMYGLKYFEGRKENLKKNDIAIASLAEHTDASIQEFVAKSLTERKEAKEDFVQYFDKSVLRTRNKGRKTKELVKSRLEVAPSENMNTQTLMELARSRNTKDREWAIEQLTKLALAGEEVEGFVVG